MLHHEHANVVQEGYYGPQTMLSPCINQGRWKNIECLFINIQYVVGHRRRCTTVMYSSHVQISCTVHTFFFSTYDILCHLLPERLTQMSIQMYDSQRKSIIFVLIHKVTTTMYIFLQKFFFVNLTSKQLYGLP